MNDPIIILNNNNSDTIIFHTISQFENSDLETPDEFTNSEPSPSTFSQPIPSTFSKPHFQPIHSQTHCASPSTPSHVSQELNPTPFYNSTFHKNNAPDKTQFSYELNNPITLQQQTQHPQTRTIHQLSSTIMTSNPPSPTLSSDYTPSLAQSSTSTQPSSRTNHAYRTFNRKFRNHPFPSIPGRTREYKNQPDQTKTTKFLQVILHFFPQYLYNHFDTNTEQNNYVDEHVLIPTLHWTSYYKLSYQLALPLLNTLQDIERNKNDLIRLTTALTPRQFTHVG